ncbi:SDR family NAD(P)-dependent oxidoreductase [Maricurvus nonylphenolicus]|uniref:SDR family NAD(P)-dependent oxidoreductase n=1 Tax=Maricurvus nonylphenolicus TaxID=1008307 RepID=UPI0036F2CF5D
MDATKHIWITGGTSGIGLSLAKHYLQQGHKVALTGLEIEAVSALQSAYPEQVTYVAWDVSQLADIDLVSAQLQHSLGHLDDVIICAGICEYVSVDGFDADAFARVMAVNFQGAINTVAAALPLLRRCVQMGKQPRPLVTVISSLSSWVPVKRAGAYGASKAALRYAIHSIKGELVSEGIDVSVIQPGFIDTPLMQKLPPLKGYSMMTVDSAVKRIINAIERRVTEYCFPKNLYWRLGFVSILPMNWQLRIMGGKQKTQNNLVPPPQEHIDVVVPEKRSASVVKVVET